MTTLLPTSDSLTRDALAVLQPGFTGTTAPRWLLRQLDEGLMAVGLFGRNVESPAQLGKLTAQLREVRPEVLVAIDEEGGDVTRMEARSGSSFPGNLALGTIDDPDLTRQVASELARRLLECGVNLNWAPSADVNSNPDNPVIGVRSFGDDPQLVARHTTAYVQGLQSMGVAASTKHFPGHGDTNVDSHHAMPRIDVDLATLGARELVPFRAAIAADTKVIMSAHILLPALDPAFPATLSHAALTGLLRAPASEGGLGFDGLVVTDAVEMKAIADTYGVERGAVLAVAGGADAVCVGGSLVDEATVLRLRDALVHAVRAGELAEERLAEAAGRVRALARWAAEAEYPETAATPDIGLEAARGALRVTDAPGAVKTKSGGYVDPGQPPYVAAFTPVANIAVGSQTPWGVAAELARLLPGTRTDDYSRDQAEAEGTDSLVQRLLATAGERKVVAVVRDVHRHPWMSDALGALLAARPDTIVVEMGVPQAVPTGAPHIATHGAARVCGRAAAEAIVGR